MHVVGTDCCRISILDAFFFHSLLVGVFFNFFLRTLPRSLVNTFLQIDCKIEKRVREEGYKKKEKKKLKFEIASS